MKNQDTRNNLARDTYAQQEGRLSMQSHAFVELLAKRGLIEDESIQDDTVRKANQTKRRNMRPYATPGRRNTRSRF